MLKYNVETIDEWQRRYRHPGGLAQPRRRHELLNLADSAFDSLVWLTSTDDDGTPFMFVGLCGELGADPDFIRGKILERFDPQALQALLCMSAAGDDDDVDEAAA